MIDIAILGLLKEQELHGYELRKRVAELLSSARTLSFGSLYPALTRLERAGLVKTVTNTTIADSSPRVPASGSLTGELAAFRARRTSGKPSRRGRKTYALTERGEARLLELLTDPTPVQDRMFCLQVAFCRHLSDAQRLDLFERRRAELRARLAERERRNGGREKRLDRYLRSLKEHDTAALTHDLAWLDRLIEAEREQALPREEPTR